MLTVSNGFGKHTIHVMYEFKAQISLRSHMRRTTKRYFRFFFEWNNKRIRAHSIIQLYMFTIIIFVSFNFDRITYQNLQNTGLQTIQAYIQHFWLESVAPHIVQRLLSNLTLKCTFEFQFLPSQSIIYPTNQPAKPLNIEKLNIIPIPISKAICNSLLLFNIFATVSPT